MSVVLFKGNEAAKIAETFQSTVHQRKIWYTYVSNVCAYNVQYKENAPIDFKSWEDNTEKFDTIHEAIWELGGLIYNAHTNAGNYFAPMGVIEELDKMVREHQETQEYKSWLYKREELFNQIPLK